MNSRVTEIASDVYRISTFHPEAGLQFTSLRWIGFSHFESDE